jgi:hypothetical protein
MFFDTNVLEPLSKPPLDASLDRIRRHLSQKYVYVVSPLTIDELLLGAHGGDPKLFTRDQAKMRVLRGAGKLQVIDPPATFALKQVLRLNISPPSPVEVAKTVEVFLRARSRQELEEGLVPRRFGRTGGINFEAVTQRHVWGRTEHARILELLRVKSIRRPTAEEWVRRSFRDFAPATPDSDWAKLATALEAAYSLDEYLCDEAEFGKYRFAEHGSDWIDLHQLFYLSVPHMHLLTSDKRLRNRVKGCTQAARIVAFQDVLDELKIPGR